MKKHFSILLLTVLLGGCDSGSPGSLPTTTISVGRDTFTMEIAATYATREKGLMERDVLPAGRGMIFVFPDEQPRSFWMHHTRFPLDILYLDAAGKVVSIRQMKAYDETPVPSQFPAKYAIELNLGAAEGSGAKVGDIVAIPDAAKDGK